MAPRALKLACQRVERRQNAFDEKVPTVPQHLQPHRRFKLGFWTASLGTNMGNFLGYLVWLLCLTINGFILFLWVVFGAAAAGGAGSSTNGFFAASWIGAGLAVVLSMYFVSKEKFAAGALLTFLTMPLVFIATFAL